MNNIINRSICLAQWKDGDITLMFTRFTHKDNKLKAKYINHHKSITLPSLRRLDRILQVYKGSGVYASITNERSMITQNWEDVALMDGITLDRGRFSTFKEIC